MKKIISILCCFCSLLSAGSIFAENSAIDEKTYLPLSIEPVWNLYVTDISKEELRSIQTKIDSFTAKDGTEIKAVPVIFKNGFTDINTVLNRRHPAMRQAFMVNTIESPEDGIIRVGAGADWWFDCYVNGELQYATDEERGNNFFPITPFNHIFDINVKKGKNVIILHLVSGSASWGVAFAPAPAVTTAVSKEALTDAFFPKKTEILCGPWLMNPNPGTMTVCFYTASIFPAYLEYREEGQEEWTKAVNMLGGQMVRSDMHRFTLNGLKENTVYEYRPVLLNMATQDEIVSPEIYSFTSFGSTPKKHRFFAVGDTQFEQQMRMKLIEQMFKNYETGNLDFFVSIGDVTGSIDSFHGEYLETFLAPMLKETGNKPPYVAVRGNHEYRGKEVGEWFRVLGESYYGFRCGDAFYLVLDSGEDKPPSKRAPYTFGNDEEAFQKQQAEWLSKVVNSESFQTAKFRIVLSHSPYDYTTPSTGYMKQTLSRLIDEYFCGENPKYRIHLWVSGHYHSPMRFVGGTNKILADSKRGIQPPEAKFPFTVLVMDGPGGPVNLSFALVDVTENAIEVRSIEPDGTIADHFTIDPDGKTTEISTKFVPVSD